jgi:hypothetical protein
LIDLIVPCAKVACQDVQHFGRTGYFLVRGAIKDNGSDLPDPPTYCCIKYSRDAWKQQRFYRIGLLKRYAAYYASDGKSFLLDVITNWTLTACRLHIWLAPGAKGLLCISKAEKL